MCASLPRCDQRKRCELYAHALRSLQQRKTSAGIANGLRKEQVSFDGDLRQALQHFIARSSWSWSDMRREITAQFLREIANAIQGCGATGEQLRGQLPIALTAHELTFTRTGETSAGVAQQYSPVHKRLMTCQIAIALCLTSRGWSCPINWRLFLPRSWNSSSSDGSACTRRACASIPDKIEYRSGAQLVVDMLGEVQEWGLPTLTSLPLFVESGYADNRRLRELLDASDIPYFAALPHDEQVRLADAVQESARWQWGAEDNAFHPLDALMTDAALRTPQLYGWRLPDTAGQARHHHDRRAAHLDIVLRSTRRTQSRQDRCLVAVRSDASDVGGESFWVSNLNLHDIASQSAAAMIERCLELDGTGSRLQTELGAVGLFDYEGRSFRGWHCHVTMASLAHAESVESDLDGGRWGAP